jgi:single-strand DNA-binding protein
MSGFEINQVTISGGLTRDPELRSLASGQSVCSLRIGHNGRRKGQDGSWEDVPNYFSITYWGGFGEWLAKNLSKGDKVVCSGELRWREWTDQAGGKRESVEVNGYSCVPVPKNGGGGGGQQRDGGGDSGFAPRTDVPAAADDFAPRGTALPPRGAPGDDDIPF